MRTAIACRVAALGLMVFSTASSLTAQTPAFPTGTFVDRVPEGQPAALRSPGLIFKIMPEGQLLVLEGEQVVARYGYQVSGDRFQIWNDDPAMGCMVPDIIVGEYRWWMEGGALRFQPINDACPGRSETGAAVRLRPAP